MVKTDGKWKFIDVHEGNYFVDTDRQAKKFLKNRIIYCDYGIERYLFKARPVGNRYISMRD